MSKKKSTTDSVARMSFSEAVSALKNGHKNINLSN